MNRQTSMVVTAVQLFIAAGAGLAGPPVDARPNLVVILADDLGYGDVGALNPDAKIRTPNLDRLAAQGMIFTDAHSGSSVCTPTRYGLLTGRYAWRTRLGKGVLGGYSPHLIAPGRMTVASLLKSRGYRTACFGKWHLGMDWTIRDGADPGDGIDPKIDPRSVDYAAPIRHGPIASGFDVFFGISASLDMPPFVFIENDRAAALPTVTKKWLREGPASPDFEAVDVLPAITRRTCDYIRGRSKVGGPLFVYMPLTSPHTPIVPTPAFQGKSGLNAYGDFVMQTDAAVGDVLRAIDEAGIADRTLVVFTSDNGCSPEADFPTLLAAGHNPSHVFRGMKADLFEGGHRVPFLVRWPGVVKAGSRCDRTICLTDILATAADIAGAKLPDGAGEDSVSLLPCLRGVSDGAFREATVHHSINGSFAIRQGRWKLDLCPDSGGWSAPRPGSPAAKALPPVQLHDLEADVAEAKNVASDRPDVVVRLTRILQSTIDRGRTTPGPPPAQRPRGIHRRSPLMRSPVAAGHMELRSARRCHPAACRTWHTHHDTVGGTDQPGEADEDASPSLHPQPPLLPPQQPAARATALARSACASKSHEQAPRRFFRPIRIPTPMPRKQSPRAAATTAGRTKNDPLIPSW